MGRALQHIPYDLVLRGTGAVGATLNVVRSTRGAALADFREDPLLRDNPGP
jgi:hypothetical protein